VAFDFTDARLQEREVIDTNDVKMTRELHVIRAHLLHYDSLLVDFLKSVDFVLETRNPALEANADTQRERQILEREGENLRLEIKRLRTVASNQDKRLGNVIDLVRCHCTLLLTDNSKATSSGIQSRQFRRQQTHAGVDGSFTPRQRSDEAAVVPHDVLFAIHLHLCKRQPSIDRIFTSDLHSPFHNNNRECSA